MENVRKHRNIKFATTEARGNYLVSEPKYHITNFFFKRFNSNRNVIIVVNSNTHE